MSAPPRRRWMWLIGVAALVLLINFPPLHSAWTRDRVRSDGIDVTAEVVQVRETSSPGADASYLVAYRLPDRVDESGREYGARVDEATYRRADARGSLAVRVLPDDPSAHVVAGAVRTAVGLYIVIAADLVLLVIGGLLWWHRRGLGAREGPLRLVALGDVQRCKPGGQVLERDGQYEVVGEVTGIADGEVVLQAGPRTVVVALGGYALRVGYQQPAWVWARLP